MLQDSGVVSSLSADRVKLLFNLFFPFVFLMLLAEAIKAYKLDDYSGLPPLKRPSFPEHK